MGAGATQAEIACQLADQAVKRRAFLGAAGEIDATQERCGGIAAGFGYTFISKLAITKSNVILTIFIFYLSFLVTKKIISWKCSLETSRENKSI